MPIETLTIICFVVAAMAIGVAIGAVMFGRKGAPESSQAEATQYLIAQQIAENTETLKELHNLSSANNNIIAAVLQGVREDTTNVLLNTQRLNSSLNNSQARGNWGELQLRRVVEATGMIHHVDFELQVGGPEGAIRPDMLIKLPEGRVIIVDAKTPMASFLQITETTNPEETKRLLQNHATAVRRHIDTLASKAYWSRLGEIGVEADTIESVVMFVPNESVLSAVYEVDREILAYASSKHVILVAGAGLLAVLSGIATVWKNATLATNAREVIILVSELHERAVGLLESFGSMGQRLKQMQEEYNSTVFALNNRLLPTIRKIEKLSGSHNNLKAAKELKE